MELAFTSFRKLSTAARRTCLDPGRGIPFPSIIPHLLRPAASVARVVMPTPESHAPFYGLHPASPPPTPSAAKSNVPDIKFHPGRSPTAYRTSRLHSHGSDVVVEELSDDDVGYASDIEVLRPDELEEVESESESSDGQDSEDKRDPHAAIVRRMSKLHCEDTGLSERRQRQIRKRWGSGLFKRTHSQTLGSDPETDYVGAMDDQDVTTRRLRRRVRGPDDRSSLIFEDVNGAGQSEQGERSSVGTPSRPGSSSREDQSLSSLPFWVLEDPMEVDSAQSCATSAT